MESKFLPDYGRGELQGLTTKGWHEGNGWVGGICLYPDCNANHTAIQVVKIIGNHTHTALVF